MENKIIFLILSNPWLLFSFTRLKISLAFIWDFYRYWIGKVEVGCRYDICFEIITQFVNNTFDMLQFSVKLLFRFFFDVSVVYFVFLFPSFFFTCIIQCKNKLEVLG